MKRKRKEKSQLGIIFLRILGVPRIHEGILVYGASTQLVKIEAACSETADRIDSPEVVRLLRKCTNARICELWSLRECTPFFHMSSGGPRNEYVEEDKPVH